jgi:pimeloyl-ACP methyl ester carboxylesterase
MTSSVVNTPRTMVEDLTIQDPTIQALTIKEPGGRVDYSEAGEGPTVVLVPGSCSTGAAWRPVVAYWQNGFRCVTTSLLGYGGTEERRTAGDADISHEAEAVEAVIRRAAEPVHLVGHSFGGLTALAVALRRRVTLLSLTIVEAPAPEILHHTGETRHYSAFRKMTGAYFGAYHGGKIDAIEGMIDFYGGAGTFAGWPQRVRDYPGQPLGLGQCLRLSPDARFAGNGRDAHSRRMGRGQSSRGEARE